MNMKSLNNLSIWLLLSFIGIAVCEPTCQKKEILPHENPNHFWHCAQKGSDPIDLECPFGQGFLKNDNRTGCISYEDWECTADMASRPSCTSEKEITKLHRHPNPNQYWVCPGPIGTSAVAGNCPKDKGFIDNSNNLGCFEFKRWVCDKPGDKSRH